MSVPLAPLPACRPASRAVGRTHPRRSSHQCQHVQWCESADVTGTDIVFWRCRPCFIKDSEDLCTQPHSLDTPSSILNSYRAIARVSLELSRHIDVNFAESSFARSGRGPVRNSVRHCRTDRSVAGGYDVGRRLVNVSVISTLPG